MKMMKDMPMGELKGVDTFGNKYYENLTTQIQGRHRYVVYADPKNVNAASVPAEWYATATPLRRTPPLHRSAQCGGCTDGRVRCRNVR